jgi:hypothetical protein
VHEIYKVCDVLLPQIEMFLFTIISIYLPKSNSKRLAILT